MLFRGSGDSVEQLFVMDPGADPADIVLDFSGEVQVDAKGGLAVSSELGELSFTPPIAIELGQTGPSQIAAHYKRLSGRHIGIELAAATDNAIVIDPILSYSSYLGGSSHESVYDVAAKANGDIYMVGYSDSVDFPASTTSPSDRDAFLTRLGPGGVPQSTTFFGGTGFDVARALDFESDGTIVIAGSTQADDFPVTAGAIQESMGGAGADAIVARFDPAGTLTYASYLGGSTANEEAFAIGVASNGDMFIGGRGGTDDFPGYTQQFGSGPDGAFVSRLNLDAGSISYSVLLASNSETRVYDLAVDTNDDVVVVGRTGSTFPTTSGAFQESNPHPTVNGYAAKIRGDGSELAYATFIGSGGPTFGNVEQANSVAVDQAGRAHIAGITRGGTFPVTAGQCSLEEAYVIKLPSDGVGVDFARCLGTQPFRESATSVLVAPSGEVWVAGWTQSVDFPVIEGAFQSTLNGVQDLFLSQFSNDGNTVLFSSYLGGSNVESNPRIAMDPDGVLHLVGETSSTDFPVSGDAHQPLYAGGLVDSFTVQIQTFEVMLDPSQIRWTTLAQSPTFDVVRGDVDTLFNTGGDFTLATTQCFANDVTTFSIASGDDPVPGEMFWYAVRPATATGLGTYDSGGTAQVGLRDSEITGSGVDCPK